MFFILLIVCFACIASSVHALNAKKVLILQNKGGGHGEIGYSFSKLVTSPSSKTPMEVTILQDSSYKKTQQPFSCYNQLNNVQIQEMKLSDTSAVTSFIASSKFDAVIDNNSKDPQAALAFASAAIDNGSQKYVYISSGGMYTGAAPGVRGYKEECCAVKEDNDCRKVLLLSPNSSIPLP